VLDWTVVLTPVLVLAMLLLVGYTGCSQILDFDRSPGAFLIVVHVPATLMVTAIEYRYTLPIGTEKAETDNNPTLIRTEGSYNVYEWTCGSADAGGWVVGCAVVANVAGVPTSHDSRERPEPEPDQPDNEICLDDLGRHVEVNYEVEVIPGGDFRVYFRGYEET
jgi:hypothetical protein